MNSKPFVIYIGILSLSLWARTEGQTVSVPFTFSGTSPVVLQMDSYGTLSALGTYGTGTLGLSGAGTEMFWYPGKAAFRAGTIFYGTPWNDANIGDYSVALGGQVEASGAGSVSLGEGGTASGMYSTAFGGYATGSNSVAFPGGVAYGAYSFALSGQALGNYSFAIDGYADGQNSFAMNSATAMGTYSIALGYSSTAMGNYSIALGYSSTVMGNYSIALGYSSTVMGNYAACVGYEDSASAYSEFVIGQYNVGGGTSSSWVSTDPLFEIGNGTSSSAKGDAMVVYKSGVVAVHKEIRVNSGGDISMGSFTAGTAP